MVDDRPVVPRSGVKRQRRGPTTDMPVRASSTRRIDSDASTSNVVKASSMTSRSPLSPLVADQATASGGA
jgi:hypothetical protein